MEGIVDPLDSAVDLADMCRDAERDESTSNCSSSLCDIMEYRDLSAWRVSIPKVETGSDTNGKACFVFVIEVQRIDVTAQKGIIGFVTLSCSSFLSNYYNNFCSQR